MKLALCALLFVSLSTPLAASADTDDMPKPPALPDRDAIERACKSAGVVPTPGQVKDLLAASKRSDAAIEKARKSLINIYNEVDAATGSALNLTAKKDAKLVEGAAALQSQADLARTALRRTQSSANSMMSGALNLQSCQMSGAADCGGRLSEAYRSSASARCEMDYHLEEVEARRRFVEESAARIVVADRVGDSPESRIQALRFAKLIEKYPDAAAPFSENAFTLLASGKEKSATVKLNWSRLYPNGWRDLSLQFSAPLGDNGTGNVLRYADGLTGIPKVGANWQMLSSRRLLGTQQGLFSMAMGVRFGSESRSFYEDGPTLPAQPSSIRVSPTDLSLAFVLHDPNTSNAHLLRASWQRVFQDQAATTRCPVPAAGATATFVSCLTGKFGAPTPKNEGVLTYQYRYQADEFAMSPTLSFNTRTRVREVALPLYLVRSADNDKRPFNAGIRADWASKGNTSITGSTRNQWSFGVFVGTAFSLFGRGGD